MIKTTKEYNTVSTWGCFATTTVLQIARIRKNSRMFSAFSEYPSWKFPDSTEIWIFHCPKSSYNVGLTFRDGNKFGLSLNAYK